MSEIESLSAEPRARAGKGGARATRRAGRVPAVVYGGAVPPVMVSVDYNTLIREVKKGGFTHRVFTLDIGGDQVSVVPRELQLDPVRDQPLHVDFLRIVKGAEIDVEVPIAFLNEEASPGLKRGGVLNVVRHELSLRVRNDAIPDTIEIDLTGLAIGDSIHLSNIVLPDGAKSTITDRDFTIATIAPPTVLTADEEAGAPAEAEAAEAAEEAEEVEEEAGAEGDAEAKGDETE
jgi:large subunit ribosomal protein L25